MKNIWINVSIEENFLCTKDIEKIITLINDVGFTVREISDKSSTWSLKAKKKIWPNLFWFIDDLDSYSKETQKHLSLFWEKLNSIVNIESIFSKLSSIFWSWKFQVLSVNWIKSNTVIVRSLSEAPLHIDDIVSETKWKNINFEPQIINQFSWNLFLKLPKDWSNTEIQESNNNIIIDNTLWSILVFNSKIPHKVQSKGIGDRFTLSWFFSVNPDNSLTFWV